MAIPPILGIGSVWTFRALGISKTFNLLEIFIKRGIREIVANSDKNSVVRYAMGWK